MFCFFTASAIHSFSTCAAKTGLPTFTLASDTAMVTSGSFVRLSSFSRYSPIMVPGVPLSTHWNVIQAPTSVSSEGIGHNFMTILLYAHAQSLGNTCEFPRLLVILPPYIVMTSVTVYRVSHFISGTSFILYIIEKTTSWLYFPSYRPQRHMENLGRKNRTNHFIASCSVSDQSKGSVCPVLPTKFPLLASLLSLFPLSLLSPSSTSFLNQEITEIS